MQAINGINGRNNMPSIDNQLKGSPLSQDSFMKLLLTQLKLQDPSSPFDSSTMMQQISQMTTLSATHELEKTVKNLASSMETSQVIDASKLVGKKVQIMSDSCPLVEGEGLRSSVGVPDGVDNVVVTIKDSNDKVVKTLQVKASSSGVLDVDWDGLDEEGKAKPAGFYKVSASGLLNGENVSLAVAGTFKVNSVALDRNGKGVIVNVDGLGGVVMQDIIKIL